MRRGVPMTQKEKELIKEGWQRRFITDEPRLNEMVQMVRGL